MNEGRGDAEGLAPRLGPCAFPVGTPGRVFGIGNWRQFIENHDNRLALAERVNCCHMYVAIIGAQTMRGLVR